MSKIIVANWKMNGNLNMIEQYITEIATLQLSRNKVIICPPIPYLYYFSHLLNKQKLTCNLGAQDCAPYNDGSYTGDISAAMLKDIGIKYIIIGHSERRQNHGEDDYILKQKLNIALANNLIPIFCIGENLCHKQANKTEEILQKQLQILANITGITSDKIIIAYEPVWAIGTNQVADINAIESACNIIEKCLLLQKIDPCILYGGSVNIENAASILSITKIAGLLVGKASLNAQSFYGIVNANK